MFRYSERRTVFHRKSEMFGWWIVPSSSILHAKQFKPGRLIDNSRSMTPAILDYAAVRSGPQRLDVDAPRTSGNRELITARAMFDYLLDGVMIGVSGVFDVRE
jgi:hypothetical protein